MTDDAANVSRAAWWAMGAIVVALAAVSLYSNVQHARRDKIESVTITRYTPSPSPSARPGP